MERTTDEMAATLSKLLDTMEKTASKHEDKVKDHDKAEDHGKDHEEKAEDDAKDKEDKTKDHKKASVVANVVNTLVKLADDLDVAGDSEASDLVDNALSIIMQNIDGGSKKKAMMFDDEEFGGSEEMMEFEQEDSQEKEELGFDDMLKAKLRKMSPSERKVFMKWLQTGHKE